MGDRIHAKRLLNGPPRQRIPCAAEILQRMDPRADRETVKLALRLVAETNMDDANLSYASQFGQSLQQEHAQITTVGLRLANKDCLELGRSTLAKMLTILIKLDPNRLWADQGIGWTGWLKAQVSPKPPAKKVFDLNYPKLLGYAEELAQYVPELTQIVNQLEQLQHRFEKLEAQVTAYYLAAAYLSKYVQLYPDRGEAERNFRIKGELLEARTLGLLETKTNLEMGKASNAAFLNGAKLLLADCKNLLSTDLPAFQTAMSIALTGSWQRDGYDVKDNDINTAYQALFNKLKVERKFRLNGST